MPTPVSTARQCLTQDAAQALDEAVAVARRRGHAQTTSLHAVSALLCLSSSSSSPLRDACTRARNGAYSARIQFKALELCLGVSLDRLPSSPHRSDEPPVSNSLMAAIKRSQANQRRQPESFHLYQQQQQQSSSVSMVKVELQNLVLSILDDPIVSRVFSESGFRSCDIKLAILRPVQHQLLRYSRYRGPPVFLCNLNGDSDPVPRNFSFPFLGFSGFSGLSNGDENGKRIGEVLVRSKGRNPLLVGVCSNDALRSFCEVVEKKKGGCVLPVEICGLNVIRIDIDVLRFVNGNCDEGSVKLRLGEISRMVEHCTEPGVVISYGDLKELIGDDDDDGASGSAAASFVVGELTRLVYQYSERKVWLIGFAATYETYLKFLNRYPSVEKDWDLQLLPITSPRPAMGGDSYPRSSLMESFVPFGGFFSTPADLKSPLGVSYQCPPRCHLCNEKCEQDVSAITKGGFASSVAEQYQSSLPSWLQMTEVSTNRALDIGVQAKGDGLALSAKVEGLQRKWNNICKRLHHAEKLTKGNIYQVGSQVKTVVGFRVNDEKKENADSQSSNETNGSSNASGSKKVASCMSMDTQNFPRSQSAITLPGVVSQALDLNSLAQTREKSLEPRDLELGGVQSPPMSLSCSDGHPSPPSTTSVTTDLGLGINAQSSLCTCPAFEGPFDPRDFKMLYRQLIARIRWQEDAVSAISQAIARCKARNEPKRFGASGRGDIWFTFLGPDCFSKKRIAVALADIFFGSKGTLICVDLSSHDGVSGYDVKFRGKTAVDYIAGELSKKPMSVVFLENIDEADLTVQNSLSQAVRTGKFSDSHGREVGISNSNTVFVTTSRFTKDAEILYDKKESGNYSEESILRAKGWPIQIVIDRVTANNTRRGISNPIIVNKRKSFGTSEMAKRPHKTSNMHLDLNLPAEEIDVLNTDCGNSESDSISVNNSKAWLEDFVELVDETVVFKPFDFDKLAEKISQEISKCFHKIVGLDCLLEIDSKVMEQVIAVACLYEDKEAEDWVEWVLSRGFVEAQKRYNLTSGYVVKLVACEGLSSDGEVPGVCLPSKILVN
ncbi:hypothetical protein RHSIM_Rhsim03G0144300 [Rhododendron simsii]|uniref:Clp R domain-containing protein n=1 Tax=Rhododendron simsii TaxID=118357 RepID=A0A834H4X5_RHOSS|nr:hypothetical protein RHSIM_Rhsim03G0144300 [Rhododendron simsii]